ncbi:endonuclease/exonuclease/phosphatase family protein [Thalassotalea psychrophila]|uniref:Endonuclease/exonuclease/phosphatase family protein n=1 Tax=Thalassotalea psychrophila TaxID=3065647 RepID=A0ABY9TR94_9GAMM|nr:endonuclease/exonuclease/phosphatase family protein [Colwelliaceae bacterium SQ149]
MSFNIRVPNDKFPNNWILRRHLVDNVLHKHQPDIIGFQEMKIEQREYLLTLHPQYIDIGRGRNKDGSGEASPIFINHKRFELLASDTEWYSDTPQIPGSSHWGNKHLRNFSWAKLLDKYTQRSMVIYNSHWGYSQKFHQKAAKLLLEKIGGSAVNMPVFIIGDFNALPNFKGLALLTKPSKEQTLADTWRETSVDKQGFTFHDFTGVGYKRLDYIFANQYIKTIEPTTVIKDTWYKRWPSDHFPVMGKFKIH